MNNGKNDFQACLANKTNEIEAVLKSFLPKQKDTPAVLAEAMNYSVLAGGKRLRPMLIQETGRLFEPDNEMRKPFMAAMEMIHTYSLVHDDLPAMDNDEYRRGKKTTWAVYGEAFGILAGDALLNYAFETALEAFDCCGSPEEYAKTAKALQILARCAGIYGMIGGQTADIEAEGQETPVSCGQLLFIHENKTAALIQAAMMAGAVLAGASGEQIQALEKCAYNIGVAFQIQDDILDVVGDSAELGKPVGSDAQNGKQTYVTLKGLEQSAAEVASLSEEAVRLLDGFPGEHSFLRQLVLELIHRRK